MSVPKLDDVKKEFVASDNFQRTLETIRRGESVVWNGCVGSSYAMLGGLLNQETKRPLLVVVSKVGDVERVADDLAFFTDSKILTYPIMSKSVVADSDEIMISEDADFGKRLRVLKELDDRSKALADSSPVSGVDSLVVVSSLAALLQPVPSREQIVNDTIKLEVNKEFSQDDLCRWLTEGKFVRTPAVELHGEYAVRGFIVDVYASDWTAPIRIEFFGDEVSSIRQFDVVDQRSLKELDSIEISRLHTQGRFDALFTERLPNDLIVLIPEVDRVEAETARTLSDRDSEGNVLTVSEAINALYRRPTLHAVPVASGLEYASLTINASFSSVDRLKGNFEHVEKALKDLDQDEHVFIVCGTEIEGQRLEATFLNTSPILKDRLSFCSGSMREGFEWRDRSILFIGSDQLFDRTISRRTNGGKKSKNLRKTIDSFMELTPKDYVIHEDYGLARYLGVETLKKANQTEDHLKLEFANNTYVYVPASQIRKIQRYVGVGGHHVRLSSYKGKAWDKKKAEVKKAIWSYAKEMLEVQATRDMLQGISYPPDDDMQQNFESLFPYRETDDQLTAIEAIKKDMERSRPMDRLLCGDVGFGKTEVAMRAAFKAVLAGYQVAVLAPTTVLVEQHYRTFNSRMNGLAQIGTLSRYSTSKGQRETIAKLAEGRLDVVVGTHRLLSKDVSFKNLGLIIIDEEQKFGVVHKERLKKLRSTVDILTLTATPIPRTLHFSLLGIRDISNLETPPADRLPVETKVLRFNEDFVRSAILRELNRGGQVYYLHNFVSDINQFADQLRSIVPEASIRVGHAQMSSEELEETMRAFVMHEFDVLVCTTIVESGLDIPNANTIFIDKSNRYGLAELHQLRGRVGREKKQAYCYLMLDPRQTISTQAMERLNAIQEYDKLGAGFQIAMRDLEIRGAGNILGTEQSGHLEAIGYEMYCDMLEAAIRAIKNEPQKLRVDVEIDLPVNATLDSRYIHNSSEKIDFYRRFDRVSKLEEAELLCEEMKDRYGRLPDAAKRVYTISKIRVLAFEFRVKRIQLAQINGPLFRAKKLDIEFRDPVRKYRLRELWQKRNISVSFLDDSPKGYVDLPRDLFDSNGDANADELLSFVLGLFTFTPDELDDPAQREIAETLKNQIRPSEIKHSPEEEEKRRKEAGPPLRAKILQRKMKKSDSDK